MKFKSTWFLATLVILLGCYVYFIEIKKADKDAEEKSKAEKVFAFEVDKVKAFDLKDPQGTFTVNSDDGTKWNLTAPIKDLADDSTIKGMLTALGNEKFEDTVDSTDLKTYGLDDPKTVITITTKDGKTEKLSVGIDAPLSGKAYYLHEPDKKILLGNVSIKTESDKSLKDLRDKKIFRKNRGDVHRIVLKNNSKDNKSEVELHRKDNDWVVGEKGEPADSDTVNAILSSLESFRATDFPSEKAAEPSELKKYNLAKPESEVSLYDDKNQLMTHIALSGKKDNNIYVTVDGSSTIYQSFNTAGDAFNKKVVDFRNKKAPFQFKKDDVTEIVLKSDLTTLDLLKKGVSWEQGGTPDPEYQVNQIQVSNFLSKIDGMKVAEFFDGKKDLGDTNATVTLKDSGGKDLLVLAWGEKTKSGHAYYVKTDKYPDVVGVDLLSIDTLPEQTLVEKKSQAQATNVAGAKDPNGGKPGIPQMPGGRPNMPPMHHPPMMPPGAQHP